MLSNIRATWSNTALIPSTCNLKRTLRDQDFSFCAVFNRKSPGSADSIEHKPIRLRD